MMNSRDSLVQAFKESIENFPDIKENLEIRKMMSQILITLSDPGEDVEPCKSWNDVQALCKEVVEFYCPGDLLEIRDHLTSFFTGVVDKARQASPTFISPEPYR